MKNLWVVFDVFDCQRFTQSSWRRLNLSGPCHKTGNKRAYFESFPRPVCLNKYLFSGSFGCIACAFSLETPYKLLKGSFPYLECESDICPFSNLQNSCIYLKRFVPCIVSITVSIIFILVLSKDFCCSVAA